LRAKNIGLDERDFLGKVPAFIIRRKTDAVKADISQNIEQLLR